MKPFNEQTCGLIYNETIKEKNEYDRHKPTATTELAALINNMNI